MTYHLLEIRQVQPRQIFALNMSQKDRMVGSWSEASDHSQIPLYLRLSNPHGADELLAAKMH